LKGEYYNGSNFASHAFTRVDSMIMFQGWKYDINSAPTGVHHTITGDQFSVRWTGKVQPQYSENYKFRVEGSGGFRLWVNNVQIINSWMDRADAKDSIVSSGIDLQAGAQYDIKLETMNADGARACQLFWECPSLGRSIHIPQSQLFSDAALTPPPPPVINHHPVANAGADITITLPVSKAVLDGSASAPKESIKTYAWTKVSGPDSANIISSSAATTEVKDLVEGTYVFKLTVTSSTGVATNDEVSVKVNPSNEAVEQPLVANAGSDVSIALPTSSVLLDGSASSPKESIASCEWIKIDGPAKGNIANVRSISTNVQDLTEGIYVFKLQITDKNGKVAHDDIRVTVQPQPPTANAGSDVSVNLPENSVVLNGSGSFAPVGIKLYDWSKVSGPNNFRIVNKNAISPVIKDLEMGTYVFRLQITDKNGTTAVDDVTVNVTNGSGTTESGKEEAVDPTIQLSIKAWPNPSSWLTPTFFEVNSNNHVYPITVTLYNQHGKMVARWTRVPPNSSIKWTEDIKKGTFFVIVEQAHVKKTIQLLKL
jgi:PA14 domain